MSRSATGDGRIMRHALARAAHLALAIALVTGLTSQDAFAGTHAAQAILEPGEIGLGDTAELRITVDDAQEAPAPPRVDGLEITRSGESTQIRIVNGQVSRRTSFLYQVRPLRTGSFDIPAIDMTDGSGDAVSTGPLALRVVPSSGTARGTPPSGSAGTARAAPAASLGSARFELVGPKEGLFVGQLEPVTLRLLVPDGVELSEVTPPTLSGAAFTISPLASEHPRESREDVDGVPTTVLTWTAAVSAVKPGVQTLAAQLDGTVVVSVPSRPQRPRADLFGDDFFGSALLDRFFGGGLRQQPIHLASQPLTVEVRPLPEAGRPADFDGAIGEFRFETEASPAQTTAGDPVTLALRVAGRGNFDRVRVAGLESDPAFKTYAPSSHFEGSDPRGIEGVKVFEQTVIPVAPSSTEIPPQHFSYFDPKRHTYVTLSSDPVHLQVASAGPGSLPAAAAAPAPTPGGAAAAPATPDGVLALRTDLGTLHPHRLPLLRNRLAYAALGLPLLVLAAALGVAGRRARREDPARLRAQAAERIVGECLQAMEDAIAREDARAFFAAVRRALQARLALRTGTSPEALTAADAERSLPGDPRLAAAVRRLLEEADAVAYAGRTAGAAALRAAYAPVRDTLKRLEAHA